VSTDSAGLSKLTQRYSLAQVMKLVSEPKEVIFAHGKAIGGEAIGVWAADNSQMFYPDAIDPAQVVSQMLAAQSEIKALTVQVGAGVHFGECYQIAGGLFGADADFIEEIAEDQTQGGEIVVSRTVHERLPAPIRDAARLREDLLAHGSLYSLVDYQGTYAAVAGVDIAYPIPFDAAFFDALRKTPLDDLAKADFASNLRTCVVAFVKVVPKPRAFLLDAFTELSLVDLGLRRIAAAHRGDVVKSTGSLGIVLFEGGGDAISFARDVIETQRTLGLNARVGVTRGEVFVFSLDGGGRDIAGGPVNIASKLSEDSGMDGILVESSVDGGDELQRGEPFRQTISRVELIGRRISV
jgi:class 3 adenylate cyclase